MNKQVIGLSEKIELTGPTGLKHKVTARIDTGATIGSIDVKLASELNLGPIIKTKRVNSAHGNSTRAVVEAKLDIAGKKFRSLFTLADRSHMKYRVLLGQNQLRGFLIDPSKK